MSRELVFVLLATRPEFASPKTCRKQLIGPMRRYLMRHDGKELAGAPGLPPQAAALVSSLVTHRLEAAADLQEFCARCGRCAEEKILK